ncbi:MAG: hypothetical protein Rubg2KO_29230 [Rubricoccaceae bacterium]
MVPSLRSLFDTHHHEHFRPSGLGLRLRAAQAEIRAACEPLIAASGLTYAELLLLEALWEADGASLDALARRVGAPLGVVCFQLERVIEGGYAELERDTAWLTPEGFALRHHADGMIDVQRATASPSPFSRNVLGD